MESIRRKIDEKLICGVQGGLCVHICRFKLRLFFSAFVLSAVFIKAFLWRKMVWMLEFLCIRGTVPAALHAQTKTNFFPTDFSCPVIWLGFTNQGRQSSYFLLSSLCSQLNQQSEVMSPSRKLALDCTQLKTEMKIHPLVRLLPRAPRMPQEDPGVASRQLLSGCSCDLIKPGL